MSQLTIGGQTLDHFDGGVKPKLGQAPLLLHRNTLNLHRFKPKQSTQHLQKGAQEHKWENVLWIDVVYLAFASAL